MATRFGAGTLTGNGTATGVAAVEHHGSALATGNGTCTAAGGQIRHGAASLTGNGTATAEADVTPYALPYRRLLAVSKAGKQLYERLVNGTWQAFPVQPTWDSGAYAVAGTPNGGIIVNGCLSGGQKAIGHYDPVAQSWTYHLCTGARNIKRIVAIDNSTAVGCEGDKVWTFDGTGWTLLSTITGMSQRCGLWASSLTDIWVTGYLSGNYFVTHYDGATWTNYYNAIKTALGITNNFNPEDCWGISSTEVYFGFQGDGSDIDHGAVVAWDGATWSSVGTTPRNVLDLWASEEQGIWTGGTETFNTNYRGYADLIDIGDMSPQYAIPYGKAFYEADAVIGMLGRNTAGTATRLWEYTFLGLAMVSWIDSNVLDGLGVLHCDYTTVPTYPPETTVEEDLDDPDCPERRLLLTIDGIEPIFWETHSEGTPALYELGGEDRNGHNCLRTPTEELSGGELDLRRMTLTPGGMTFELEDWESTAGRARYLAQIFAPGLWTTGNVAYLDEQDEDDWTTHELAASATTIPLGSGGGSLDATGAVNIGDMLAWYGGNSTTALTGVTLGKFPCCGPDTTWAVATHRPRTEETHPTVCSKPFSYVGRRVALHVTTKNRDTDEWKNPPKLLYVGRISEEVAWDPVKCCWTLSTRSLLEDQDAQICNNMGKAHLEQVNLMGPSGLTWGIILYNEDRSIYAFGTFTIGAAIRPVEGWGPVIVAALNNPANWTAGPPYFEYGGAPVAPYTDNFIRVWLSALGSMEIIVGPYSQSWVTVTACHAWRAMGAPEPDTIIAATEPNAIRYDKQDDTNPVILNPNTPYEAYSPLDSSYNGSYLRVDDGGFEFYADQGDANSASAWLQIEKAKADGPGGDESKVILAYSAAAAMGDGAYFTLRSVTTPSEATAFVGQLEGDDPIEIRQIYIPTVYPRISEFGAVPARSERGPFELLLHSLVSTGTKNFNGEFDLLPLELCGPRIPEHLVDTQSFLTADAALWGDTNLRNLAYRIDYRIGPDPIEWSTLLQRELQTFGYCLAWDIAKSKLSLKPVWQDVDTNEYLNIPVLGEAARFDPAYCPMAAAHPKTVVNCWDLSLGWDPDEEEPIFEFTIEDNNSVYGLGGDRRTVKIEHPGVYCGYATTEAQIRGWLQAALVGEQKKAIPWSTVDEQLAPHFFRKVSIGDRVRYYNPDIPNQFGTGLMGCNAIALVLDRSSKLEPYTGMVKLLLYAEDLPPGGS